MEERDIEYMQKPSPMYEELFRDIEFYNSFMNTLVKEGSIPRTLKIYKLEYRDFRNYLRRLTRVTSKKDKKFAKDFKKDIEKALVDARMIWLSGLQDAVSKAETILIDMLDKYTETIIEEKIDKNSNIIYRKTTTRMMPTPKYVFDYILSLKNNGYDEVEDILTNVEGDHMLILGSDESATSDNIDNNEEE